MNEKTSENKEIKQYVFKFECAEIWEKLTETEDENVRHCQQCNKNVHSVQNYGEFISNAERGHCIYSIAGKTVGIIEPPEGFIKPQVEVKPEIIKPKLIPRIFRFAVLFVVALPIVSLLPVFIQRIMIRSQVMGNGGDVIKYDWKFRTLYSILSDSKFSRPEENFAFYLALNIALAFFHSFVIAFFVSWIIRKIRREK